MNKQIDAQVAALGAQYKALAAQAEEQSGNLPTFEDALRSAQGRSNEQRTKVRAVQQGIQALVADEIKHGETRRRELNARRDKLAGERNQVDAPDPERLAELADVEAAFDELAERAAASAARFDELDMRLNEECERHACLEEAVIDAERKIAQARERLRSIERQAHEAQLESRLLAASAVSNKAKGMK